MSQQAIIRAQFRWWRWVLSTLTGTVSLISLLQHLLDAGVGPMLHEFLAFYRKLTYPIIEFPASIVSFRLTQDLAKDVFVLSSLLCGACFRNVLLRYKLRLVERNAQGFATDWNVPEDMG